MSSLLKEAQELAQFSCANKRTVCFVGDMGTGKSHLINSLLDFKDLAKTGSSGGACTNVVTEYHFHDSHDFTVQVELFEPDELANNLVDPLRSYRAYHLKRAEMTSEDTPRFKIRAEEAENMFAYMFGERLGDKTFLLQDSEERVLRIFKGWAAGIVQEETKPPTSGLTLEKCSDLLMKLSSGQRKGLILVDLPGLRDLNPARSRLTQICLRDCDEVFVTCDIMRATNDRSILDVFELARQQAITKVGIICTKTDGGEVGEAIKEYKDKRASCLQQLKELVDEQRENLDGLEAEYNDLTEEDGLIASDPGAVALAQDIADAKRALKAAEFDLDKQRIEFRNEATTESLIKMYKAYQTPAMPQPNVFCVSSKMYRDHRDGDVRRALPYLELSGIMAVRQHCIAILSDSQHLAATDYMRHRVQALLDSIQVWAQSLTENADVQKHKALQEALVTIKTWLKEVRQDIAKWSENAQKAELRWRMYAHQSYDAFCRNWGVHAIKNQQRDYWNEEIIEGMVKDLKEPWETVCKSVQTQRSTITSLIGDIDDKIESHLGTGSHFRRQEIIRRKITDEALFRNLLDQWQQRYIQFADGMQTRMYAVMDLHLTKVRELLDIGQISPTEADSDVEFYERVEEALKEAEATHRRCLESLSA
ncbi:tat pathway signal sequence [Purpureocillium lilacinum]|uniref:Tat pathway signal sequence n=1 Tax=Purpureocillium lilacinum TaxID=33203 RepID=A0A179HPV4_PURLI|nr:tat pathway signal sequence [Purpureocillium lilacinum]OAQ91373.1 tat pathway signal sequence [Purpureocillium lilacinum]